MAAEPHETPQFRNAATYTIAVTVTVRGGARRHTADRRAEAVAAKLANPARLSDVVAVAASLDVFWGEATPLPVSPNPSAAARVNDRARARLAAAGELTPRPSRRRPRPARGRGRAPRPAERFHRQAWRVGVSTIEAYRHAWSITDPHRPLGAPPGDPAQRHAFDQAAAGLQGVQRRLAVDNSKEVVQRAHGRANDLGVGIA